MFYSNNNYTDYNSNAECLNLFPMEFITRHNCIAYGMEEDKIVILVNNSFNYFDIGKISFFTDKEIILCEVNKDEWQQIFKLIEVKSSKTNAMYKYQINKDESNVNLIKEDVNNFYHYEIGNSPIVKLIDSLIIEAITLKASDIHIEPCSSDIKIKLRIDGKLVVNSTLPITSLDEISNRLKVLSNLDITKKFLPQDGKIKYEFEDTTYDIRISVLPTIYGERFALRILDLNTKTYSLDNLGFSESAYERILKLESLSSGMVLVVGPTGSGKSTTLQAFLSKNRERCENIITVEDPVEYTIEGINQVQVNEESGLDFAKCLRTILRQDPNIIMIGEIRDVETAKIACRASITGHLVYSTLHTIDSYSVINRLIDMEVEKYLLVDSLKGIISQRLIRILCPYCKKEHYLNNLDAKYLEVEEGTKVFTQCGCSKCNYTGYLGRRAIYEVIYIDEDLRKVISEGKSSTKFYQLLKKKKIETLFDSGKSLILNGFTSIEELKTIIN